MRINNGEVKRERGYVEPARVNQSIMLARAASKQYSNAYLAHHILPSHLQNTVINFRKRAARA